MIEELQFVRLKFPRLIPLDLIENVKGRTYEIEQFLVYQEANSKNENNLLYALIDEHNKIQGYFWAELSALDNSLFINTFSIKKEHWHKGEIMQKVFQFVSKLKEKYSSPRVFWITTNERFFIKHGLKRSKNILLEYNQ